MERHGGHLPFLQVVCGVAGTVLGRKKKKKNGCREVLVGSKTGNGALSLKAQAPSLPPPPPPPSPEGIWA